MLHIQGVRFVGLPFGLLRAIVKWEKVTARMYKLGSRWTDFHERFYWELLLKTTEKIKFG